MEAKKSLGQHFLINESVAEHIATLLKDEEVVIEIGGGKGALTKKLLNLNKPKIVVVEIDNDMVEFLKNKFEDIGNFYLIKGDGKDTKVKKVCAVCGNLPYNTSKAIIKNFVFQYSFVKKMVFMVQKEVAQTITAKSGDRNFGKFSVLCQLYYDTAKLFDVNPGSFKPKPKVVSSVVEFKRKDTFLKVNKSFFNFLDRLFNHPRKMVKNNLNIDLDINTANKRPSDLTMEEIYTIWSTKWQTQ